MGKSIGDLRTGAFPALRGKSEGHTFKENPYQHTFLNQTAEKVIDV